MMFKSLPHLFFLILLLTSCKSFATNEDQSSPIKVLAVPTVTVPAGQRTEDVFYDDENIAWIREKIQGGGNNGMSIGVWPAYKNRYDGRDTTFFVADQDSFIAQAMVGNSSSEPHEVAIICLLDYIQTPCTPQLTKEHLITVPGKDFAFVPIELIGMEPGLHDFNVLVVRDPYLEAQNVAGENIRYFPLASTSLSNILVDGLLMPPELQPVKLPVAGQLERARIMALSYGDTLTNEYGNFPIWIEAEGKAGEMLTFDLHFHAEVHDEDGDIIAVMAFLNYEQTPLIYEGYEYLPLYVERQAGTWQKAPVQIQLPETPGTYELVVMGRTDAFSAMEDGQAESDLIGTEVSNRIKITVNP